ncbi:MAG: leucyl/phenylalanyl-tRNA--protein transferase, partial [Desulfocapsa sp.]
MTIFQLNETSIFPKPEFAEENGLLAVGGDLSIKRLLSAYSQGIFPWYSDGDPPLWWFTDPRLVLFPDEFHVSKRLARTVRNSMFRTTFDTDFEAVIRSCADVRRSREEGTWISLEIQSAFIDFHHAGYAHSVECWLQDELAGGLYGIQ